MGSALVVSAAVARSGVIEKVARSRSSLSRHYPRQIVALVGSVTLLSAFVRMSARSPCSCRSPSSSRVAPAPQPPSLLMPISFGALLGASDPGRHFADIIVSRVRERAAGRTFWHVRFHSRRRRHCSRGLFFLLFGWRLLPRDRKGAASMDAAFNLEGYTTEVTVPEDSPAAGVTVKALEELGEGETKVITLIQGWHAALRARRQCGAQVRRHSHPARRADGA